MNMQQNRILKRGESKCFLGEIPQTPPYVSLSGWTMFQKPTTAMWTAAYDQST